MVYYRLVSCILTSTYVGNMNLTPHCVKELRYMITAANFSLENSSCGWLKNSVVYHIYPLGMLGCERSNYDWENRPINHRLSEINGLIPHLLSLGMNAIYFGPIFESSTHGYDTKDYFHIDRRLGDDGDFARLTQQLHEAGIRVMVDGVFNHVGREFWGFKEVLRDRENARTVGWFRGLRFDGRCRDGVKYDTWEGHEELVKLDLNHPEVRRHLFDAVSWWIDQFDIDGIRLDAADCLEPGFIRALRQFSQNLRPDFQLMGEVIHGDYRQWAGNDRMHGTTNYEAYKGLWSSHNDGNFHEIAYSLNREFGNGGIYRDLSMYSFVDNHDVDRVASKLKSPLSLYSLYAMMFLMPGTPSVYYGSEWGMIGKKTHGYDADLPVRPAISVKDLSTGQVDCSFEGASLKKAISQFSALRREHSALCDGDYRQIEVKPQVLAFERSNCDETVICIVSDQASSEVMRFSVPDGTYMDILNHKKVVSAGGQLELEVYPHWARVLVRL